MSNRNREAGHEWERFVVRTLKEKNIYPLAITTRQGSQDLDRLGIDVMNENEYKNLVMDDTIQCKLSTSPISYPLLMERIHDAGRPHPVIFHKHATRSVVAEAKGTFVPRAYYAISYLESYLLGMAARKAIERIKKLPLSAEVQQVLTELNL